MSGVMIATRTIVAMENAVRFDQGNTYRGWLAKVIPHLDDAYRENDKPFRGHMGASQIGNDCARAIWNSFYWVKQPDFSGRMVRLFNRGHLEEGRIIALLLTIGCQFYQQDANGKQFRISFGSGHGGGSGDGIVVGIPDIHTDTPFPILGEFKTHNEKSFKKLAGDNWSKLVEYLVDPANNIIQHFEGEGVKKAKFEHYVQMQIYMLKMGFSFAIYIAVNKNDDSVYAELVPLDVETAERYLARAEKLISMTTPPKRIATSPGAWACKFCDYKNICHLNKPVATNCRTCVHVAIKADKIWHCTKYNIALSEDQQRLACHEYCTNTDIYK